MTTDEAEAAEEAEEERRSIEWHAQGATCLFENIVNLIAVGGRSRRTPKDVAAHLIGRFNPKFWDDDEDPLTPERGGARGRGAAVLRMRLSIRSGRMALGWPRI
jgi:hypothetical protein